MRHWLRVGLRFGWRGLRGSRAGWFTIIACLALGVGAIAASLSLDHSLRRALSDDARALLGGDAELRLTYRAPDPEEQRFIAGFGTLSQSAEMRVMARRSDGRQTLAEVKTIDAGYPLFGALSLSPALSPAEAVADSDGLWGAAAEQELLDRLGLQVGDHFTVGAAPLVLRAVISREPDRASANFSLGPRLLLAPGALAASGLLQPGSLVHYLLLVKLAPDIALGDFRHALEARYPAAPWQWRDASEATPSLKRLLDRTTLFLTLVGLTSLLVGGIGIGDGTKAFVDQRLTDIARLKCLGAPDGLILFAHVVQFAVLSAAGLGLGLLFGAAAPGLVVAWLGARLPVTVSLAPQASALGQAALFGLLACVTFATLPLARAAALPGAQLLRDRVAPRPVRLGPLPWLMVALAALALAGLTVLLSADRRLAAGFVLGGAAAFLLFWFGGRAVVALAGLLARRLAVGRLPLRLALSSLSRPGAPTQGVVLSLGLGLSLLVGLTLVQVTLSRQIDQQLPARAPSFFFIDIQSDQAADFDRLARAGGADRISRAVMIRGRITRINDVPVDRVKIAADAAWAVKGDRGLTVAATPPADANIVAGQWWPPDYDGPPLVSLDAATAKGFGVGLNDTVTVDVLGRPITARIVALRRIDWASLGMNFTFVLSPNALAGAPVSEIATVHAPPDRLAAVERSVSDGLPSISVIRIADALAQLQRVVDGIGLAIRAAAAVALVAGALVLAAAIAAGQRRRVAEAVLLKVLGAARADLLAAVLWEFLFLGLTAALAAALVGSLIAWAVLTQVLHLDAAVLPLPVLLTLAGGVSAVTVAGLAGTWRALEARPAPYLRGD